MLAWVPQRQAEAVVGPGPGAPSVGADTGMWRDKDRGQGCIDGGTPESMRSQVDPLSRGEN